MHFWGSGFRADAIVSFRVSFRALNSIKYAFYFARIWGGRPVGRSVGRSAARNHFYGVDLTNAPLRGATTKRYKKLRKIIHNLQKYEIPK